MPTARATRAKRRIGQPAPAESGLRILVGASELFPYSKTGGLADMVAALAKTLAKLGHQVAVVTPLYQGVQDKFPDLRPFDWPIKLPVGDEVIEGAVCLAQPQERLTFYFIKQADLFERPGVYGEDGADYPDNPKRFAFLAKCVAQLARNLPLQPQLVHLHDWHVGLVPLLIKHQTSHAGWINPPRTCLTIHNLAYQGCYPSDTYRCANLPLDYFRPDGVEFYGFFSFLKAGIVYADAITAVSPRYAEEITTPELGCGLEGILRARRHFLSGILNGVDYDEWRTRRNPFLPYSYGPRDFAGKTRNKLALQTELGLAAAVNIPLFGTVSRLAHQKGVDILLPALEEMLSADMQFVLLGQGQPEFEAGFEELAKRHPAKVAVRIGYDHPLAHRIQAGADFLLMPSFFEPCGLNQMYSLHYGTVPVVRATGGLANSVIDVREDAVKANGIKFHEYSAAALAKAIRKALVLYQAPDLLRHLRRNGMAADFSWEATAQKYLTVFHQAVHRP